MCTYHTHAHTQNKLWLKAKNGVIPTLEGLRQEDCCKLEVSLGYTTRTYLYEVNTARTNDDNDSNDDDDDGKIQLVIQLSWYSACLGGMKP